MGLQDWMLKVYFNFVYNPLYDVTTARLPRYRNLQAKCVGKFSFSPNDRVLCVGLGTGNELDAILRACGDLRIVGIDTSTAALHRAEKRALGLGKLVQLELMDARKLEFDDESFDQVLCLHVMDFVSEIEAVTREILRVLKRHGQYVVTYPSEKDTSGLGSKLIRDTIEENRRAGKSAFRAYLAAAGRLATAPIYLPLLLRPNQKAFAREALESLMRTVGTDGFSIEEDIVYQDFIVFGRR